MADEEKPDEEKPNGKGLDEKGPDVSSDEATEPTVEPPLEEDPASSDADPDAESQSQDVTAMSTEPSVDADPMSEGNDEADGASLLDETDPFLSDDDANKQLGDDAPDEDLEERLSVYGFDEEALQHIVEGDMPGPPSPHSESEVLALDELIEEDSEDQTLIAVTVDEDDGYTPTGHDREPRSTPAPTTAAEDLEDLLDAIDDEIDVMAGRTFEMFSRALPEARQWPSTQREAFIQQAKGRYAAVLSIVTHGSQLDEVLRGDLQIVGANAASSGSSLSHLQLVLRISRDLLVHTTLRLARAQDNARWDVASLTFIGRMLPSIDRLTDALARGYWEQKLDEMRHSTTRLTEIVRKSPYGFYDADLDGIVRFTNPGFGALIGKTQFDILGSSLADVLNVQSGLLEALLAEHADDIGQATLTVGLPDGQKVALDFDTVVRRSEGTVVGFSGIVRSAATTGPVPDLDRLVHHIEELRRSLEILADAGSFLQRHAFEMTPESTAQSGVSVQRQAERLQQIVHELNEDRKAIRPPIVD